MPNTDCPEPNSSHVPGDQVDQTEQDAAVEPPYSFVVHHPHLERESRGRLGTDEGLLRSTGKAVSGLAAERAGPTLTGGVFSTDGSYEQDLYWKDEPQGTLLEGEDALSVLISTLLENRRQLEANARLDEPLSHRALHIPDARIALLWHLAHLREVGARATIRRLIDGAEDEVPMPSLNDLEALPKLAKAPNQVIGQLTGVGIESQTSCRVEITKGKPMIVEGMTLAAATKLMLAGCSVTGTKVEEGGVVYLRDAKFDIDVQGNLDV
ncbi:hypothetical protein [Arenimonas sp.]|uniref:hypothetical protein n=1 Tax=Arenimonas sp. TaxID=1872635 RepID=UPI0025C719BC|nr:hypothetical protein [Arenimonas sp.]